MSTLYHVNPETGNVLPCRAKQKCRFGSEAAHYSTAEEGRAAFEKKASLSVLTNSLKKKKLSRGAKILLALDRAEQAIAHRLQTAEEEGRNPYDGWSPTAEAQVEERNRLKNRLKALPWDHSDAPAFDDSEKVHFETQSCHDGSPRRGYANDSFTPDPISAEIFRSLDRASAVWISRLSTAEVKAVVQYNLSANHYAQHTAGLPVEVKDWEEWDPRMVQYFHSAMEKAPRTEKPFMAYAGISQGRTVALNKEARTGIINLNRVQSASANPAQVNGFMMPSDPLKNSKDQTAVEFMIDRVASLSAFNVHKREMELLIPPGTYEVKAKYTDVAYYWAKTKKNQDKDIGRTTDITYQVEAIDRNENSHSPTVTLSLA